MQSVKDSNSRNMGPLMAWILSLMDGPASHFIASQFAWVLFANFSCALGLTLVARRFAPKIGFLDCPDEFRKRQSHPIPLLGGVAIYIPLAAFFAVTCFLGHPSIGMHTEMPIVFSAGLCCAIGLWDDRFGMQAKTKFLLTGVAVLPAAFACAPLSIHAFQCEFELGMLAVPLTAAWLIICTHVVNLLDGLDGLAAMLGVAAMMCVALVGLAVGDSTNTLLALLIVVSIAGFLVHNWPPAKIYLGDAGSLTIGLLCGALSVSVFQVGGSTHVVSTIGLLAIPVIDTMFAITRRCLEGRSIACADSGHIHHCLLSQGNSKTKTLLTICSLSLCIAIAAVLSFFSGRDFIAAVVAFIVLIWLAASGRFGRHELGLVWELFRNRMPRIQHPWTVSGNNKVAAERGRA